MSISSEPFQRTVISTKPLGPTILEVLNCGFHKQKVRNQRIFRKRKTTATRATVQYRSIENSIIVKKFTERQDLTIMAFGNKFTIKR
jgi:hypothetical protein